MAPILCITCGHGSDHDHRWCVVGLFKENKIKSLREWQEASESLALWTAATQISSMWRMYVKRRMYLASKKPIVKKRIRALVKKEW